MGSFTEMADRVKMIRYTYNVVMEFTLPDILQQVRRAIESENVEHARRLLGQLLQANPDNDGAWVLLAQVIKTPEWQRACLERALVINPENKDAKQALLLWILAREDDSPPPVAPLAAPVSAPLVSATVPNPLAGLSLDDFIRKLHEDLNILKEREAKYANAAPLFLLNQLGDYETAIALAKQARNKELSPDILAVEFSRLNLEIKEVVIIDQDPPRKPFTGVNPYRGLRKFTEDDADFFFGRNTAIQTLLDRAKVMVEGDNGVYASDLMAVLGPSGSGKSSLVRAGLIPAIHQGRIPGSNQWPVMVLLPGDHPLESLVRALKDQVDEKPAAIRKQLASDDPAGLHTLMVAALNRANKPDDAVLVLVVDQFEELFTLCTDEQERRRFIDQLLYAGQSHRHRCLIVVTMRSDFYSKVAAYKALAEAITRHQMLVSPLTEKELREAILLPAEAVGLELEKDLVEQLLADTRNAPGVLPLLQHALYELFQRHRKGLLTLEDYKSIGGVKRALAHRANGVVNALKPEQQQVARRIFMRLVQPGSNAADTRRRATMSEIGNLADVDPLVTILVNANLLIKDRDTGQDVLDVSHEALIQEWPMLRDWLNEDREFLLWQQRLGAELNQWQTSNFDEGALLRGAPLAEAENWYQQRPTDLNQTERDFIEASINLRNREAAAETARAQRELDAARNLATEQRKRVIWLSVVGGVALVLAVVAIISGVLAVQRARDIARQNRAIEAELAFSQTIDPAKRLAYLVTLFNLGQGGVARRLFWETERADQLALFMTDDDQMATVIQGLYMTLADVNRTGHTDPLLAAMASALAKLPPGDTVAANLRAELDQWQQARLLVQQGEYQAALAQYDTLVKLNGRNPATRYERAAVLVDLLDYAAALAELDHTLTLSLDSPAFAANGVIEGGAEFATPAHVNWAIRRLLAVHPELGQALNQISADYPAMQQQGLVLAPTPTPIADDSGSPMVLVPAGPFTMGSNRGQQNERPVHQVDLAAFYIDQYEVTNAQFVEFLNQKEIQEEDGFSYLPGLDEYSDIYLDGATWKIVEGGEDYPVNTVSFSGANAYCQWRGARLPTEAEWEKAARGTDERTYPWGEAITCNVANFFGSPDGGPCQDYTARVGSYPNGISPYGAYDMVGNVWEYVRSVYKDYPYNPGDGREDTSAASADALRVLRGGSWNYGISFSAATYRNNDFRLNPYLNVGFRCAAEP
ncbi:MAG: Hercynine oxygenase [Anaerolineae bacterium]|nr:Hercynine oxygenase [Anaerolineae bacterium]